MLEVFLIIAVIAVIFLGIMLYLSYVNVEEAELALTEANSDNALLQRKVETLTATNESLRAEIRQQGATITALTPVQEEVIEVEGTAVEEPNPQHFRPMFDSQGALFNEQPSIEQIEELLTPKPTNDLMFYPESFVPVEGENLEEGKVVHGSFFDEEEEEVVGYESGQGVGPEPVQDGEETPNGVLRSE